MTNIYIIKCEDEKWYVGKSSDPERRYKKHCAGGAAAWTTKYKPVSLEKVIEDKSDYDEDKYVKEYMGKYGIDNVRGGSYVMVELLREQKELLQKEIWAAEDRCVRCGHSNHFVAKCYAKKDVNGRSLEEVVTDMSKQMEEELAKTVEARKRAEEAAEAAQRAAEKAEAEKKDPPTAKDVANVASKWFSGVLSKVNNEFANPDSDLRSGRVVKKWF